MFVTHLESALDGTRFDADRVHTVHQGRPLWVRYDLARVRAALAPTDLAARRRCGATASCCRCPRAPSRSPSARG